MKSNDDNLKREIGLRIQTLRKSAGLTAADLRQLTGIGLSTLQNYEAGLRHPPRAALDKIAKALGASSAYLACFTDDLYSVDEEVAPAPSQHNNLVPIESDTVTATRSPLIALDKELLSQHRAKPENLAVMISNDELMEPTIMRGAQVIIDKAERAITSAGIYALEDANGNVIFRHGRSVTGDNSVMLSTQREADQNTVFLKGKDQLNYTVIGRMVGVINWL